MAMIINPTANRPPITPPTIAPIGVELEELLFGRLVVGTLFTGDIAAVAAVQVDGAFSVAFSSCMALTVPVGSHPPSSVTDRHAHVGTTVPSVAKEGNPSDTMNVCWHSCTQLFQPE